jgi:hypothetical protein
MTPNPTNPIFAIEISWESLKEFLSRQAREARKGQCVCHFDPFDKAQDKLREKSFLDPSRSLGMTGIGPSPLRLGAFAGDIPSG